VLVEKDIVIQDACIIFDLIDLGLMGYFFDLELTVFTTAQVIGEITDPGQLNETNEFIESGKLTLDSSGRLEKIEKIFDANPGLSFADSSVLELAIRKNGTVLSSDLSLRKTTKRSGINVRGVLWIIEELVNKKIINSEVAIKTLNYYSQINSRSPKAEINLLINKLESI
jgi:rRNA-processing protein FCF1